MVSVYILHIVRLTFGWPSKAAAIEEGGGKASQWRPWPYASDETGGSVGCCSHLQLHPPWLSLSLSLSPRPLHYLSLIGNSLVPRPIPIPRISSCNIEILGMGLRGNMAIILIIVIIIIIIARAWLKYYGVEDMHTIRTYVSAVLTWQYVFYGWIPFDAFNTISRQCFVWLYLWRVHVRTRVGA